MLPNHEHFPNAILKIGETYHHKTIYKFQSFNKMKIMGLLLCCFLFTTSCNSQTNEDQNLISATIDSGFAKGADVGWLPQMEATGYKFYDTDGTERDCLQL
jgi:arabinogalactan endo-1,4-beta-galactosidase